MQLVAFPWLNIAGTMQLTVGKLEPTCFSELVQVIGASV
jgi:hypothetical protein